MPVRFLILSLLLCSLVLQGESSCWYPGPFPGTDSGNINDDPDKRCTELPSASLPGLGFVPVADVPFVNRPLWVVNAAAPQGLLAFDAEELPPVSWVPSRNVTIPADSDKDGVNDAPVLNGLRIESATLGLITADAYDEVLLFDPTNMNPAVDGGLATYMVSLPVAFGTDYPRLPDPAANRTAVSTMACVDVSLGLDAPGFRQLSNGDDLVGNECAGAGTRSFHSDGTTGATAIGDKLFVSLSNPAPLTTPAAPIYRPGTVLVFDFPGDGTVKPDSSPAAHPSIIFTKGYNPTDVVGYDDGSKNYILVISSGVIPLVDGALEPDDLAGSFVELIDADNSVWEFALPIGDVLEAGEGGDAALSGVWALDAANGMLYVGSAVERTIYTIVLSTLIDRSAGTTIYELNLGSPSGINLPDDCDGSVRGMDISNDGSEVYAVDYCAGTLIVLTTNGTNAPTKSREFALTFPIDAVDTVPETGGETDSEAGTTPAEPVVKLKGPTRIAIRPGVPGVDYEGSDLFVLVTEPEGRVCAQNVQAK